VKRLPNVFLIAKFFSRYEERLSQNDIETAAIVDSQILLVAIAAAFAVAILAVAAAVVAAATATASLTADDLSHLGDFV